MGRIDFPKGFWWGAATAAYQIEGSHRADGKGESIWDRFSHTPGRVARGETGDIACDHYARMESDVALMAELGLTSYRFSISWPRVLPSGGAPVSQAGLDFYRRLCDTLLEAGIRPLPTLYHWDLPQALEDIGGWTNRDMAGRFAEYAGLVGGVLGDRIDTLLLFNEPHVFTLLGYMLGTHAPGHTGVDEFLRAAHIVALAQGDAFRAVRAQRPRIALGSAFSMSHCEPLGDSEEDALACERYRRFNNLFFLEPALRGRYPDCFAKAPPEEMMDVRDGDMERCAAPLDLIGINLYTRTRVQATSAAAYLEALPADAPEGPVTDMGWEVWPDALYEVLVQVTREYDTPAIEITENGCAYDDGPDARGRIEDARRIEYLHTHLAAVARAIAAGADVRGYHAWSLLDNFEWAEGYAKRFGLIHVDFATQKRTLKDSARWYQGVIRENGFRD